MQDANAVGQRLDLHFRDCGEMPVSRDGGLDLEMPD
jgi:hypothetical protein